MFIAESPKHKDSEIRQKDENGIEIIKIHLSIKNKLSYWSNNKRFSKIRPIKYCHNKPSCFLTYMCLAN